MTLTLGGLCAMSAGPGGKPSQLTIRVGYGVSARVSPVVSEDQAGEPRGYLVDLLREMGTAAGAGVQFKRYATDTNEAAAAALAAGEIDVWLQVRMNVGDPDPAGLVCGPSVLVSPAVVVMKRLHEPVSSVEELRAGRVGCAQDGPSWEWMKREGIEPALAADGFENVLGALKDGRVEYVIASMLAAASWIDGLGLHPDLKFQVLQNNGFTRSFTYATRPGDEATAKLLDKAFTAVRNSGAASLLYTRHIARYHARAMSELLPHQTGELPHRAMFSKLRVGVEVGILPEGVVHANGDGTFGGYLIDVTNEIGRLYGVPVEYESGLGSGLRNKLNQGELDILAVDFPGTVSTVPTEITRPYLSSRGALFVMKGTRPPESISDLQLFRLAAAYGSPSHRYLKELRVPRIAEVTATERGFDLIRKGEADGVVTPLMIGRAMAVQGLMDGIEAHELPGRGYTVECGYGVRGGNAALLWDLEDAMAHLRQSGFVAKTERRWLKDLLPDPTGPVVTARHVWWVAGITGLVTLIVGSWFWSLRSELRRRTSLIREAELRFHRVFESSQDAMVVVKPETGTVIEANRRTGELLGTSCELLVGRDLRSLGCGVRELESVVEEAVSCGHSERFAVERVGLGGAVMRMDLSATAVRMGGECVVLLVSRDVTVKTEMERHERELEQRLRQSERLESIGRLAGGVAHDFNNLLVAIMGNATLARQALREERGPAADRIDTILLAAQGGADLTRQMLAYAGRATTLPQVLDLSELVRSVQRMMDVIIQRNCQLVVDLDTSGARILADRTQVSQLVMNLLANASDAMTGRSGVVTVRTSVSVVAPDAAEAQHAAEGFEGGRCVRLEVSDTGCGMTREVEERMFEPFFSTKFAGRGLGLSAALGMVKSHGGAIGVTTVPGKGTTVRVYFPAVEAEVAGPSSTTMVAEIKPLLAKAGERGCALIVDDEPMVREVTKALLATRGYGGLVTVDGGERALEMLGEPEREFEFVVLDLTMPGIGGPATLREIARLYPRMPVVLMSGNILDAPRDLAAHAGLAMLAKPFTLDELEAAIDEARGAAAVVA